MKIVLDIETVAAPIKEWAALVGLNIAQVESDFPIFEKDYQKSVFRSGPVFLDRIFSSLSGALRWSCPRGLGWGIAGA